MKLNAMIKTRFVLSITMFLLISSPLGLAAQDITTHNTSEYLGKGSWKWTIFIQAQQDVLNEIERVEYALDPTFQNPIQRVDSVGDPQLPFALTDVVREPSEITVKIIFRNAENEHRYLKHMIALESPSIEHPLPIQAGNVAESIGKDRWKWTVFILGSSEALGQIQCVEYTLHPTFPERVHEVCQLGIEERPFALSAIGWGTFTIRIRVFLNNGQVQRLAHHLKF